MEHARDLNSFFTQPQDGYLHQIQEKFFHRSNLGNPLTQRTLRSYNWSSFLSCWEEAVQEFINTAQLYSRLIVLKKRINTTIQLLQQNNRNNRGKLVCSVFGLLFFIMLGLGFTGVLIFEQLHGYKRLLGKHLPLGGQLVGYLLLIYQMALGMVGVVFIVAAIIKLVNESPIPNYYQISKLEKIMQKLTNTMDISNVTIGDLLLIHAAKHYTSTVDFFIDSPACKKLYKLIACIKYIPAIREIRLIESSEVLSNTHTEFLQTIASIIDQAFRNQIGDKNGHSIDINLSQEIAAFSHGNIYLYTL